MISYKTLFRLVCCLNLAAPLAAAAQNQVSGSGKTVKIVFLGDSITAGYGIDQDLAFPKLIETSLNEKGFNVQAINSGISGSTAASGPSRLKWLLKSNPNLVFLELGANEGLRGSDIAAMKDNLKQTIALAREQNVRVVLIGMQIPPNYGSAYRQKFAATFEDLAKEEKVDFIPFVEKFFGANELLQADGLHPNAKGHKLIAQEITTHLLPILKELAK